MDNGRAGKPDRLSQAEPQERLDRSGFDPSRVERLALGLRSHAYAMGAARTEQDEEVALGAARLILPALEVSASSCRNCEGAGWVCENHQDRPWGGNCRSPIACECGAGAPCPVCQREMACAPFVPWWEPMTLAPKDGTEILVAGGTADDSASMGGPFPFKGVALVTWVHDTFSEGWRGENSGHHDEYFWHDPQWWMPRPPLPPEGVSAGLRDIRARASDSDGRRNGRDAKRLDGGAATARAEGIAQSSPPPESND